MEKFPGLAFRGFAGKGDFAKMASLLQAISVADEAGFWLTAEDIERDYQHLVNSVPARDMLMVEDASGTLLAYVRVGWEVDDESRQVFGFPFNIHPEHRSLELNRYLLQWVEQRSKQIAAETGHMGRSVLRAMLRNADKELLLEETLRAEQFQSVRFMKRMRCDLSGPIELPPLVDGIEIHPVPETHFRALVAGIDEAFRDHWGHAPFTEEAYQQFISDPDFRPELWQVAWDGDQIVSGVLNHIDAEANTQFNVKRGWTDPIFTRRPWRKRGLARALLMRSLQMFKEMGMSEAMLGVDTQNPSGAFRLYESCGFVPDISSVVFEKEVRSPGAL